MRTQYNFWPGDEGLDGWDVARLIELTKGLPIKEVALADIPDVDTTYWFSYGSVRPTVRAVVEHLRLIQDVDPSPPIILAASGRVMDGMHRVARALLEGRVTIPAVQFEVDPEPDHRNCSPDDLPY